MIRDGSPKKVQNYYLAYFGKLSLSYVLTKKMWVLYLDWGLTSYWSPSTFSWENKLHIVFGIYQLQFVRVDLVWDTFWGTIFGTRFFTLFRTHFLHLFGTLFFGKLCLPFTCCHLSEKIWCRKRGHQLLPQIQKLSEGDQEMYLLRKHNLISRYIIVMRTHNLYYCSQ